MKKIILGLLAIVAIVGVSNAQVMKKGDNALNLGIGVPDVVGTMRIPAIIGAFDMGVSDKLGIGYISAGAQATLSGGKQSVKIWGIGTEYKTTNLIFGGRAAYHFDFVDITGNDAFSKFDIYGGFFAGLNIEMEKETDDITDTTVKDTNVKFKEDFFVGARWAVSDALRLYAEAGYNIAYISAGVSLSF